MHPRSPMRPLCRHPQLRMVCELRSSSACPSSVPHLGRSSFDHLASGQMVAGSRHAEAHLKMCIICDKIAVNYAKCPACKGAAISVASMATFARNVQRGSIRVAGRKLDEVRLNLSSSQFERHSHRSLTCDSGAPYHRDLRPDYSEVHMCQTCKARGSASGRRDYRTCRFPPVWD